VATKLALQKNKGNKMSAKEFLLKLGLNDIVIIGGKVNEITLERLLEEFLAKKLECMLLGSVKLFCFECEIETPIKDIKGDKYCANCGLKH